jgi:hypothetical protein
VQWRVGIRAHGKSMTGFLIIVGSAALAFVLCLLLEHSPDVGEPLAVAAVLGVGFLRIWIVIRKSRLRTRQAARSDARDAQAGTLLGRDTRPL